MHKKLCKTTLGVCLAAISISMAFAQTPPNPGGPSASHQGMHMEHHPFTKPTERVEARLAYVRTALKITDAQQAQWDTYANFVRKDVQEMEQRFQSMHAAGDQHSRQQRPNAIESLERQQAFHTEAAARIAKRLEVEKPLYAALSTDQQKIADAVLSQRSRQMPGQMPSRGGSRGR